MRLIALSLVGVAGGLVVNDLGSGAQTASLLVSVAEPTSMTLCGIAGVAGLSLARFRRGRAARAVARHRA